MPGGLTIELEIDEAKKAEVERLLAGVPRGMNRALSGAINTTLTRVRTIEARAVRDELNLKYGEVLDRFAVRRSTVQTLAGSVTASRKPVPMAEYDPKQTAAGVTVRIRRGRGVELLKGAFVATMPSGHVGVFRRTADATHRKVIRDGRRQSTQLPIKELYGPTVVGVLAHKPGLIDSIRQEASELLDKAIDSKVSWLLARAGD